MKKIIFTLFLLMFVLATSGCTSNQQPVNKNYSSAGLSFVYPGSWNNTEPTSVSPYYGNSTPLAAVGDTENLLVIVYMASSPQINMESLQQLRSQVKSDVIANRTNNTYVSDSDITIEGTKGLKLVIKDMQSNYITMITWMKNNKAYGMILKSKDSNPEILNNIINTIQTP